MTNYEFGLRVKRKREELGYTQDMLAKMIGYKHKTSIAKIENGERDLPRKKIIELAEALHTTPDYLMGWNENAIGTMDSQENHISFLAHKVDNGIPKNTAEISEDEKLLIDLFRSVPDDKKKLAIEMIRAALKAQ